MTRQAKVLKRTVLECGRVALAKLGHDPYGMFLKDRSWPEIVRLTYASHLAVSRDRRP